MISNPIDDWIDIFIKRDQSLFLSTENNSWTYKELAEEIKTCKIQIENKSQSICMIQGDYSLNSVAWMITGLCFNWRMVPVVSSNKSIIEQRKKISKAIYSVSPSNNWKITQENDSTNSNKDIFKDSGVVLFSSGTTGEPKAMCKDLGHILLDPIEPKSKPVCMGLLLLFDHIGGLNTLLSGIKKSSHLVAPLQRNPSVMASLVEAHNVRVLPCSPTFLNMMHLDQVFDKYDFKSLRLITYGTERMPEELLKRLSLKLPRVKFLQTFGTSEIGIVQTKSLSSSSTFLTIDDPNVEWKIENKELWVKSKNQISGYINTNEKAIDSGWFKTGDLVETKDDTYFKIVGRKNEVINVGGEKVLPAEIEDFVMAIEGVDDCTAFSVANGMTGQAVGIKVIVNQKVNTRDLKKIIRKLSRQKLEGFKVPVKIIFDTEMQHTERFKKER